MVDASVAVRLSLERPGFPLLSSAHTLLGPPLLWSETMSVLHELRWRDAISERLADIARGRLMDMPVERAEQERHREEAWRIADEAGWAKTYDAEYVATARLASCPLVTLDERLQRGASRFVDVRTPADL